MPIEIRELQIRVTINETQASAPQADAGDEQVNVQGLIRECIEQVTEIINSKKER